MPSERDKARHTQQRSAEWHPWQFSLMALMVILTLCAIAAALWPPPTRSLYLYDAEEPAEYEGE